jgi:hypothetical protein
VRRSSDKRVLLAIASVIVLIIIKKKTIGMMAIVFLCCDVKIYFRSNFNYVKRIVFFIWKNNPRFEGFGFSNSKA